MVDSVPSEGTFGSLNNQPVESMSRLPMVYFEEEIITDVTWMAMSSFTTNVDQQDNLLTRLKQ